MSACAPSLQFTKLYQHLMGLPMDGSLRTNAIIVVSQGAAVPGQPVPEDKSVELIEKAQLATQLHLQVDGPLAATNTYHGLRFVGKLAADVVGAPTEMLSRKKSIRCARPNPVRLQ